MRVDETFGQGRCVELILSVPAGLVCLSTVYLFFLTVVSYAVFKTPSALHLRFWAATFWAPAIGGTTVVLRPFSASWVSEYLGCMCFVAALSCAWLGMRSFWFRPLNYWLPAGAALGIVPLGLVFDGSEASMALSRQLYIFLAAALFFTLTAWELRRSWPSKTLPSQKLAKTVFSSFAALHVFALPFPVLFPLEFLDTLPASPWLFVLVVASLLHTVAATFMCLVLGKERAEAQVRRMAETDVLTGLNNRRAFVRRAEQRLKSRRPSTLLLLDLDRFKQINDQYGHSAGDKVLKVFSQFLKSLAGGSVHVGRLGGEEFGMFLANRSGPDLEEAARQICEGVSVLRVEVGGKKLSFTVSVGISDTHSSGHSFRRLFEDADTALYQAKRNGRNRYCRFRKPLKVIENLKISKPDTPRDVA